MSLDALVIGAGPAGLMAAETLARGGASVVIAEAMPTPARKFLMAGKSGLNLTKNEDLGDFLRHFSGSCARSSARNSAQPAAPGPEGLSHGYLGMEEFGPADVIAWAEGLGSEVFTGSTKRVFPREMKGSPLLRAWLARLEGLGVELRKRWRWHGLDDGLEPGAGSRGFCFETEAGAQVVRPKVTVLALGGASWPRLGSDAGWVSILQRENVEMVDFRPANMGFYIDWSEQMSRYFGAAVKGVSICAGDVIGRGEWVISKAGIEGGGIYELSHLIRDGAQAWIDLAPDLDEGALAARFARAPAKLSRGNRLRRALGDPVRAALLMEWGGTLPGDALALARLAKSLPLRHLGAMPLERAISSAGGITAGAMSENLELQALPGIFAAGEMLDWEAPTGGYLLTACLASGRRAGLGALGYLASAD